MRLEPNQDGYDGLFMYWEQEGKPARISWQGADWLAIRDNDIIAFARINSVSGVDSGYGSSSIPMK